MPFEEIENQKIYYTYQKSRAARLGSVILVHGAGGSHLDWPPELRRLDRFDVYAVDLPGHGRSKSPGFESIEEYTAVVRQLIYSWGTDDGIVVGHSMGGAVVQYLGLNPPISIRGLVLVATGARLRVAPQIMSGVIPDFEKTVDVIIEYTWSENSSSETRQLGKQLMLKNDPETMLGDFRACNDFDLMDELKGIHLPTLIICGTEDLMTPVKYSRFLADHLSSSRLAVIERAGHMVMLEEPGDVASLIIEFAEALIEGQE